MCMFSRYFAVCMYIFWPSRVLQSSRERGLDIDRFEQVLGNSSHQSVLLKYRTDLQSNAASTEL